MQRIRYILYTCNQYSIVFIFKLQFIAFAALVAVALAAPQRRQTRQTPAEVYVINETPSDNIGLDSYKFGYQLSDGSAREESAQVETRGAEDATLRVSGSFSFVGPDGQTYTVTYIADENGFQPQGAHLPVSPQA